MSTNCLYTSAEIIAKIKTIDTTLDDAVTGSTLDNGQTKSDLRFSTRTLREQKEYYLSLLQQCYPAVYQEYFGKSVIQFRGPRL